MVTYCILISIWFRRLGDSIQYWSGYRCCSRAWHFEIQFGRGGSFALKCYTTDYPADHTLASLSALRCLSEAPEGYVTGAPFLLAQALSCPYTIILPPENPAGDHFVHALHMASNASPIDENIVVRMARSLIGLNNTNCNDWSSTCPSGALGHYHFRRQSCRDGNGAVSAYLFAFSQQSLDDNEFAETLMDLMAPRIGRDMERNIGRTATPKKEAGNLPEAILEAVPAAITLCDTDGRFTFVNKWGAGLYKISQRDIIGKTQSEVFGANSTTHYVEELARNVREIGETINNAEIVSKCSAGQAFS